MNTYIYASGSNTNYGTEQILLVGHNGTNKLRSLLKFDMSSIPSNATITSATLILRMNSGSGTTAHTMNVYPVLKNWTETGVTWNKFDGTTSWQVAGASGATDSEAVSIGTRSFISGEAAGFKSIPLNISTIQEYVNGARTNNGWILTMDVETGFLKQFASSDSTTAANRPQLVVEYTLPEEEPDWVNKAYAYGDEDHKHAVTSLVVTDENNNQTSNTYRYDANGNMTCRIEDGETFLQAYNAENRMSGVLLVSGDCDTLGDNLKAWVFTYDGDGVKVKQEYTDSNGTLTTYYYAGGSYEVQTNRITETVRQYYAIAGVTAGMREDSTFYYFLTDHLGSVIGVTDSTGTMVSETRYLPFGEIRTDVGTINQTDYGYTFQKNVSGMGLMDYKARYFSTYLNHWIQPDTIIPDPYNPQSWNRYTYVNGNPINFNDPTGHRACDDFYGRGCKVYKDNYSRTTPTTIFPRSEWGALPPGTDVQTLTHPKFDENLYTGEPDNGGYMPYIDKFPNLLLAEILDSIVIHHEGETTYLSQGFSVTSAIANIQLRAMENGLFDIQYAFIVAPDGRIFEGRDISVRGAHVSADAGNTGRIGILLLGVATEQGDQLTENQIESTINLIVDLNNLYGINNVFSHREIELLMGGGYTDCPGNNVINQMSLFRSSLK